MMHGHKNIKEWTWSSGGNISNRGNPKCSEKTPFQCHSVHHQSNVDWSVVESVPPQWEADKERPEPWQ